MASLAGGGGGGPPVYADCDSRNTCEICFAQVGRWATWSRHSGTSDREPA